MIKTIITFLIIFSVIVVYHEFGHYYFAKKAGIRVREFALGMGPKLFSKQDKEGTTYTIRMLPLGGYVRLAGLNEEEIIQPGMQVGLMLNEQNIVTGINLSDKLTVDELPVQIDEIELIDHMFVRALPIGQNEFVSYQVDEKAFIIETDGTKVLVSPRATRYESATPWNKIKTNIAGPVNNFILSIIGFMLVGLLSGGVMTNEAKLGNIMEGTPAFEAGLLNGDKVISIDGELIENWNHLVQTIQSKPNETVPFVIERNHSTQTIDVKIAAKTNDNGQIYGQIGASGYVDKSLKSRLLFGFTQTYSVITTVLSTILGMFKTGFDINQFGGPVAMAQATSQVVEFGGLAVISLMAMLSANLGIMNLLPIPALDGGKIVLNIYEAVRGKPLAQEKEGIITIIGVGLLVILMIVVTWNDIMRAFF